MFAIASREIRHGLPKTEILGYPEVLGCAWLNVANEWASLRYLHSPATPNRWQPPPAHSVGGWRRAVEAIAERRSGVQRPVARLQLLLIPWKEWGYVQKTPPSTGSKCILTLFWISLVCILVSHIAFTESESSLIRFPSCLCCLVLKYACMWVCCCCV